MEDLTEQYGGLKPLNAGSMVASNTVSDNSAALTAPGSPSEATADEKAGDPALHATSYDGRRTEDGHGPSHLGEGAMRTWTTLRRPPR